MENNLTLNQNFKIAVVLSALVVMIVFFINCGHKEENIEEEQEQVQVCSELQYKERGEDCVNHQGERYPGQILTDEEGNDYQAVPEITGDDAHERFKQIAYRYHLDPGTIRNIENKYNIREGVILAIIIAETSGGNNGKYVSEGCYNLGNVDNTDGGNRRCYSTKEESIEAIGRTLNNKYQGQKDTIACLSKAGHCRENYDNGAIYAGSTYNRERTVMAILQEIYQREKPDASITYFRRYQ